MQITGKTNIAQLYCFTSMLRKQVTMGDLPKNLKINEKKDSTKLVKKQIQKYIYNFIPGFIVPSMGEQLISLK